MLTTTSRSFIGTRQTYLAKRNEGFCAVAITWGDHFTYHFFSNDDEAVAHVMEKGTDFLATISPTGRLRAIRAMSA